MSPGPSSARQPPVSEMPRLTSFYQYRDAILLPNVNISQCKDWSGLGPSHAFRRAPFVTGFFDKQPVLLLFTASLVPSLHHVSFCPSKLSLHPGSQDKVSFMRF